jgi:hypothetical protein
VSSNAYLPRMVKYAAVFLCLQTGLCLSGHLRAQVLPLNSINGLRPLGVQLREQTYHGRKAVQVVDSRGSDPSWAASHAVAGGGLVILPDVAFHDGTITVDVAGKPQAGAFGDARGFVGVAFRVAAEASKYELVYIRPTNGRSDDQLRRNHSTQYSQFPDYEWSRLRSESPGKYESYVDLETGEWTALKIEVAGTRMKLYVNGASQPALIVNDLKMGDAQGGIALWVGSDTEAYFSNLRITK